MRTTLKIICLVLVLLTQFTNTEGAIRVDNISNGSLQPIPFNVSPAISPTSNAGAIKSKDETINSVNKEKVEDNLSGSKAILEENNYDKSKETPIIIWLIFIISCAVFIIIGTIKINRKNR
jgi:hypothetical protein